jgi:sugar (pentulose or hexulose) kinase
MEKVIAVFDIGKTNKKFLLFNEELKVVRQSEEKFLVTTDDDGVDCDDIDRIEQWISTSLEMLAHDGYQLEGVNFSTYGATLVWVDADGRRLTPLYDYMKPIDEKYQNQLFEAYGGKTEFCRCTASPSLGVMLNSGIQILWMKQKHREIFDHTRYLLHFPQYLASRISNKYVSELTSIGCHTFLWNFDEMRYHDWVGNYGVKLPEPVKNDTVTEVVIGGRSVKCGVGIHDSSASLVPYLKEVNEPFLLISTGTWCINMNPFNHEPLTADELEHDSLCYLSANQQSVKSSRLFMGHIHDVNTERLTAWFNVSESSYKSVKANDELLHDLVSQRSEWPSFFANGIPDGDVDTAIDLSLFPDFDTAYHQLMYDLTLLTVSSVRLVLGTQEVVKKIFISGGFSRNVLFVKLMRSFFPQCEVLTTEIDNASALGAAMVIAEKAFPGVHSTINLGLNQ